MRRFALIATAALLAACQPPAPNSEPPDAEAPAANTITEPAPPAPEPTTPAPSQASIDYRSEMRLTGTEPFWGVHITSGQIKLMRPDHADLVVPKPAPKVEGGQAVWQGAGFTVKVRAEGPCSDGMSDRVYPFTAEIDIGGEVMKGCAARADAMPKGNG